MFDQVNLPNPRRGKYLWYTGIHITNAGAWLTWTVPRNTSLVYMLCLGGGGSGGSGVSSGNGVSAAGGGGGGSGGMARLLIAASFLPKQLYISPGIGGVGVLAASGNAGVRSYIADKPFAGARTQQDLILVSGAAAAGAGGIGGGGGTGETIAVATTQPYSGLGLWTAIAGQTGPSGGINGAAGGNVTWGGSGICTSAGASGGSTNSTTTNGAGGNITGAGLVPTIPGGAVPGGNGQAGLMPLPGNNLAAVLAQMFAATGGAGGAGTVGGTGGNGAAGGLAGGGGGGGGGGGTGGGTGGASGDGGPGLVFVAWW